VGFLGKIFGPLGYAMGVIQGDVPPAFGVTLPTNDLIWWVPFGLILIRAWQSHERSPTRASSAQAGAMPRRAAG
jgi:hypothetical protein